MSIRVQIPTPMRQHTGGKAEVEAAGANVKAVLDDLGKQFPGLAERMFDKGQLKRFVNVYLNDEDIRFLDNLNTAVKDGDQIAIIPAAGTARDSGGHPPDVQPDHHVHAAGDHRELRAGQ